MARLLATETKRNTNYQPTPTTKQTNGDSESRMKPLGFSIQTI